MMRISVFKRTHIEMSDSYLKQMAALGVDCLDFGRDIDFPGVKEQGYPDLDGVHKMRKRIRAFGLDINRVTLPDITEKFMQDQEGGQEELENSCKALQVFGEAGIPMARQRFAGDVFPELMTPYQSVHRGGYLSRGESRWLTQAEPQKPGLDDLETWWSHFCRVYERLVPIAEEYNIKLALHPSDTPNPDTPLGGLGFHRVLDAFPSRQVGFIYCIGTRAEAGGSSLVVDEINMYGRKGRIFMCHMRNVRGSLATAGGFEEVLLDDGDLNMFKIILELKKVGFEGCINPDHIPLIPGDDEARTAGWAYSVGYIKALMAALAA
jgi:mannonate dehydratase